MAIVKRGAVELPVAAAGQPVTLGVAAGSRDRRRAGVGGEGRRRGVVPNVADLNEDLGCDQGSHARDRQEVDRLATGQLGVDVCLEIGLFVAQRMSLRTAERASLARIG